MGSLNEINQSKSQSYGDNSFTTTVTNTTVEFDSSKDSFTFKDKVDCPEITLNGEEFVKVENGGTVTIASVLASDFGEWESATVTSTIGIIEGEVYNVKIGNYSYESTAIDSYGYPGIEILDTENNINFFASYNYKSASDNLFIGLSGKAYDVTISKENINITKIPSKFLDLPESSEIFTKSTGSENIYYLKDNSSSTIETSAHANTFCASTEYNATVSATDSIFISSGAQNTLKSEGNSIMISSGSANKAESSGYGSSISILSSASNTNNGQNTMLLTTSYNNKIAEGESMSYIIGGSGSCELSGGGYNKLMLNCTSGSKITASNSTIISANATVANPYSIVIGGTSQSTLSDGAYNIVLQSTGGNTIKGAYNMLLSSNGGNSFDSSSENNIILSTSGGNDIKGANSTVIGGLGGVSVPATVSNAVVIGGSGSITIDESNMVYVPDIKIKVGDNYYKLSDIVTALVSNGTLN